MLAPHIAHLVITNMYSDPENGDKTLTCHINWLVVENFLIICLTRKIIGGIDSLFVDQRGGGDK